MKGLKLALALAVVFVGISAHAQSGFKIDPVALVPQADGTVLTYSIPSLQLPANAVLIPTNGGLQEALIAAGDALYKKASQQSMILRPSENEPVVLADGPEPIPLCWPWPGTCKVASE